MIVAEVAVRVRREMPALVTFVLVAEEISGEEAILAPGNDSQSGKEHCAARLKIWFICAPSSGPEKRKFYINYSHIGS